MRKTILLTESQLTSLIKKSLKNETKPLLKEWGYDYGVKGKQCISWQKLKDGTIISGKVVDCEILDKDGFIKKEYSDARSKTVTASATALFFPMSWNARFEYPDKWADKKINDPKDKEYWSDFLSKMRSPQDLMLVAQYATDKLNTFRYHHSVPPLRPNFGEALANYLNTEKTKEYYNMFKNHFNEMGVGISLGKGPTGYDEIIINYNAGKNSNLKKSSNVIPNFCPKGQNKCSGTYTKCCDAPKIAEAQKCLGLDGVGKWGPKTQKALEQKFPKFAESFTDADVATICAKK